MKKLANKMYLCLLGLFYGSSSFAGTGLKIELKGASDIASGDKDLLQQAAIWAKAGLIILLAFGSVFLLFNGITSISSALKEFRSEKGSIPELAVSLIGAVIAVGLGLLLAYLGLQIVNSFNAAELGV